MCLRGMIHSFPQGNDSIDRISFNSLWLQKLTLRSHQLNEQKLSWESPSYEVTLYSVNKN